MIKPEVRPVRSAVLALLALVAGGAALAQADFTVRFEPGCGSVKAFFIDQSVGAASHAWDFGDGATSTAQQPVHRFAYATPISVTLTIQDAFGNSSTSTQSFPPQEPGKPEEVRMPNVFTPNGDGVNDLFRPLTDVFWAECASLQVFDRWGHTLFRTLANDLQWDGRTMEGMPAVAGTYFYVFTVNGVELRGTVQLLR